MLKRMQKTLSNNKKGFSLIELIVVIAIIGILVMLAAPRFLGYTKDANVSAMKSDVKILSDAAMLYNIDAGTKEAIDGVLPQQWPVLVEGDDVVPVEGDTAAIKAIVEHLSESTGETVTAEDVELVKIDVDQLTNYVKNTKNNIDQYGLVLTDGEFQGEVFHLNGVSNKENVTFVGKTLQAIE